MDINERLHNIVQQFSRRLQFHENVPTRLYNDINSTNEPVPTVPTMESLMSVCSANELGQSCRICRWNRADLRIQQCPCECKGSVGHVHLKCLRRWILHRGSDHCEICGKHFILNPEEQNYKKMFWSFFRAKYFGAILKNCIHLISLGPISYVVLYQVLKIMDKLQIEDHNTLQIMILAPVVLLTSSVTFFHILEFSITRCLTIKNLLKHWWNFGGQDSDSELDMEVPSEVFEFF